ncbi:MAG: cell division protein SepF, partial [Candidatus Micrarchaeota archaeon]|nr:cell division protein SepF [Candidatus Micrarchaeota archaeon]
GDIDMFHQTAERYVVPVALVGQEDVGAIKKELSEGNLVLVNFEKIKKLEKKVTKFAGDLHTYASSINGDIARLGADKLLMTPRNVKIIKKRISLKR